jgi:hypothetical protein
MRQRTSGCQTWRAFAGSVGFSRHHKDHTPKSVIMTASNRAIRGLINNVQTDPVLHFVHSNQLSTHLPAYTGTRGQAGDPRVRRLPAVRGRPVDAQNADNDLAELSSKRNIETT